MLVIRGENIYPSAIEEVLRGIEGIGGEFRIIVTREKVMDELIVQAEYTPDIAGRAQENPQLFEDLEKEITTRLKSRIGIRPTVELQKPNTLERTEFKSRRVLDKRDYIKRVQ